MLLALLLACAPKVLSAQPPVAALPALPPLTDALPVDPAVHEGTLANGLRWYVQQNHTPAARAELRLVVHAGSLLEDDDQRGLAHMLEHMAFNGTEHFPHGGLVAWFESIGMSFGAHVNASTGFDDTIYTLTVPTDRPELLDQALLVLSDQAGRMTLDPTEIDKERGVVLEEWRTGRGAGGRVTDALTPFTFAGSRYAERLPIGTPESVKGFDPAALRRFYTDWYRPDLMAVIAVGDFDPATVEHLVETHFAGLTNPPNERPRPALGIPPHAEPVVAVVTDPELPSVGVTLLAESEDHERNTWGGYRELMIRNLVYAIMNDRIEARRRAVPGAWLGAGVGWDRLGPSTAAAAVMVQPSPDAIVPGLRAVLDEVARARRYGFSADEVELARKAQLSAYESYRLGQDTSVAAEDAAEIVRVFTTGEAMPGTAAECDIARRILASVQPADLDAYVKTWMTENLVLTVTMPDKPGLAVPTEAELRAVLADMDTRPIAPPVAAKAVAPLVRPLPKPGHVVSRRALDPLGVTVWTLSNGVEVWVKPTDYQADEVLLGAWSPGGTSLVPDDHFVAAATATAIRDESGLGKLDPTQLGTALAGHEASAWSYIGSYAEGVRGSAAPRDLETMLQLVYLDFTAPRFTDAGLAEVRRAQETTLANRLSTPEALFGDAANKLLWGDSPRHRPWTVADLDQLDLAASRTFYRERFADAADFHFVIVGNVDPATLEPLVDRYLGSLPGHGGGEKPGDDGLRRLTGARTAVVHAGVEPKAEVSLDFEGPFTSDWGTRNQLQALAGVLEVRLREELREERGGVYGVNVGAGSWEVPDEGYSLAIDFTCDPARVDELTTAALRVVGELRDTPVDERYIDNEKEMNRRERETQEHSNGFWLAALLGTLEHGEDPLELLGYDERNAALSAAVVQSAAKQWLDPARLITVELLPAEGTGSR
jgi:zinc protease